MFPILQCFGQLGVFSLFSFLAMSFVSVEYVSIGTCFRIEKFGISSVFQWVGYGDFESLFCYILV